MRRSLWISLPLALCFFSLVPLTEAKASRSESTHEPSLRLLELGSFRSGPLEPNPGGSPARLPFSVLEKRFETAKGVALEELGGWFSGRCYFADAPSTPVASLLAMEERADLTKHGPAFAGAENRKLIPLVDRLARPDRFDRYEPRDRDVVSRVLARHADKVAFAVRSNDSLVVAGLRTENLEAREYRLRRSGKFLIMRLTCAEPNYCLNPKGGTGASRVLGYEGDTAAVCYYFRQSSTAK